MNSIFTGELSIIKKKEARENALFIHQALVSSGLTPEKSKFILEQLWSDAHSVGYDEGYDDEYYQPKEL